MTLYGDCEARGRCLAVTISELDRAGCALACEGRQTMPDGEMALWIGAIGPLEVIAMHKDVGRASAAFKQPLDPRILEHFGRA